MHTTRPPAAASRKLAKHMAWNSRRDNAAPGKLAELPADVLGLVLYQLPLAHDIAATALTCHTLHDAA